MSLYQKYRPLKFEETLTQTHITNILQSSLKKNNLGHAYLFVGTRGAGKTSLARIFARALNCQNTQFVKKTGEPCNECESCKLSLNSSHPDIIEMDAASNRGIEEIRLLKESVDFVPSMGINKVYIIDEVHMMTKEAFNALLKTLEEPPKHVVFIMCTTEVFKIPPTIISRSQVFELKFASLEEIVDKMSLILGKEGRDIDTEGKKFIAKLGKGSFRDTESILEKVLNSSEKKQLSFEEVTKVLGFTQFALINEAKDILYSKDLLKAQSLFQDNLEDGSIINFVYQLSELIYEDVILELKKGSGDKFKIELFDFLTSLDKDLKNTLSPKMIFIAKILNFISNFTLATPVQVIQHVVEVTKPVEEKKVEKPVVTAKGRFNPSAILRKEKATQAVKTETEEKPKSASTRISKIDFLEFVKERNSFLYRFFVHKDFEIKENKIVVEASRKMEKDLLVKPATQSIIREFGEKVGTNITISAGETKVDHNATEEKAIERVSKKVEDLTDEEIKDVFKLK